MIRVRLVLWFSATLVLAADHAQLAGRVEDPSGAVLVDTSIAAVNEDSGFRRTTHTDDAGAYVIGGLAPGIYKVTARKPGFQTIARVNVDLAAGRETHIDFVMRIGSVREVVTVEDGPKLLRLDDGSVEVQAGRRLIDTLPLGGRGVLGIVELAPGVLATPASRGEAGQFSTNGQRANTNYFTVDGVSANTGVTGSVVPAQFAGGALPSMTAFGSLENLASLDAIQEVRVETSSFAPEFGRMPGAQVVLRTRSGTEQWHGSLSYAFRNEALAANDWFASSRGYGRSPLRLQQWGGALGGPVRRHGTFIFAAWEGLRLQAPFARLEAVPSETSRVSVRPAIRPLLEAFPIPNGRDVGSGMAEFLARGSEPSRLNSGSLRIDHALTPHIALFGRYIQAPSSTRSAYLPTEQTDFATRSVTAGVTVTASPSLVSDSRLNISADSVLARWLPDGLGGAVPVDLSKFLPSTPNSGNAIYGIAIGGLGQLVSGETSRNRQGQMHLVESVGWTGGRHAPRFGVDYERLTPERQSAATAVAGTWPSLSALLAGMPVSTAVSQADQASSLIEILSFYAQDTWRAGPRLTLTYGARWEITPAPSIRQSGVPPAATAVTVPPMPGDGATGSGGAPPGVPASPSVPATTAPTAPLWPTRYGQLAPRLGAAYRISDRSVVRAGGGVFYDLSLSAATDPINGFPYNRWQFGPVGVAGLPTAAQPPIGYGFAPGLRLPYSLEWNLAYEHALTPSDVVSVSFVASASRHLLRREAVASESGNALGAVATNHGAANFHALEAEYRRRLSRGFEGMASYTWGHSIDNGSWDSAVAMVGPQYGAKNDRGSSSFDVRHSFSAAVSYESRGLGGNVLRRLSGGWNLQGIIHARTGFPIDVMAAENLLGFGFDDYQRPDLIPGVPVWMNRRLNPAAFFVPVGQQGTLGRNAIAGFGMFQVDMALERRFAFREAASLEFGAGAYNVLNHPNLADPVRYLNSPFFGEPVSMLAPMLGTGSPRSGLIPAFQTGGPRSIELRLKLRF